MVARRQAAPRCGHHLYHHCGCAVLCWDDSERRNLAGIGGMTLMRSRGVLDHYLVGQAELTVTGRASRSRPPRRPGSGSRPVGRGPSHDGSDRAGRHCCLGFTDPKRCADAFLGATVDNTDQRGYGNNYPRRQRGPGRLASGWVGSRRPPPPAQSVDQRRVGGTEQWKFTLRIAGLIRVTAAVERA